MSRTVPTFCRICEASCGLLADVEGDRVLELRPDHDHVVSKGFVCSKGIRFRDVHHSPDRVAQPLKRVGDRYEPVDWDTALSEIGAKLRQLSDAHGPSSIGIYAGNPVAFSFPHAFFMSGFAQALSSPDSSPNLFAAGSQDCNNKFVVSDRMYGSPMLQPIPDFDRVRCFILVGTNPAVSQLSFVNAPRAVERLKAIERGGGRIFFVNPRRTESARQVGEQVFIRPGTDVYFMLSFAHELFARGGEDPSVAEHLENVSALREAVAPWPAERTEPLTGIPAATLREMVAAYCESEGSAMYASTGLNQARHSTLAFWLLSAINAVSGNLDRRGGILVPSGLARWLAAAGVKLSSRTSRIGGYDSVMETFPAAILPDEIFTPGRGQIRAMIVSAGNPVLSCANSPRMAQALGSLELLVSVDLFRNETGNLAHYILPVPSFLERDDMPLSAQGYQPIPFAQVAPAVVPPLGETRDEWWIFTRLLDAMGKRMFGVFHRYLMWSTRPVPRWLTPLKFHPRKMFAGFLMIKGFRAFTALFGYPHGRLLAPVKGRSFLGKWVPRPSGKVDAAPAEFLKELEQLTTTEDQARHEGNELYLITKRERHTHNSWMHNVHAFVSGRRHTNYLYMHPKDASRLGLVDGQRARARGEAGTIALPVKLSDDLMPGVVAVPHGWGHQQADGLSVAQRTSGVNVNEIAADGPRAIDRLSGMTLLTGLPVQVEPEGGACESAAQ